VLERWICDRGFRDSVLWKRGEILIVKEEGRRVKGVIKRSGERLNFLARDI
jgi:hypothetical protein